MSVFKVFKDNGAGCAPLLHLYAIEFALFSSKTMSFYSVEFALSSESSMNCVGKGLNLRAVRPLTGCCVTVDPSPW